MAAPARVELGRIVKPHGLKGELVVSGVRLAPEELLAVARVEALAPDGARRPLTISAVRPFLDKLLVCFEGVEGVDAARLLHGNVLEVDPARLPAAEEGMVYLFQLVGLSAETEDGRVLGRVADVMQTGAAPILVVRDGTGRERLLPMIPEVLVRVSTAEGRILVRLLPGMEEL